ncbi:MAG: hypothetical protein ACP5SH_10035 [Syntrophobacteraceae bacterium]
MAETRQVRQQKKKKGAKEAEDIPQVLATDKKKKLKQLDSFIENVLEQAGEEFLEEFKQIEGQ